MGSSSGWANGLKLLAGSSRSAPTRQQTLRAALDWSYGLLSGDERATFSRLSVFAGGSGFSLELARAVAAGAADDAGNDDEWSVIEHLSALVDRSLVAADGAEQPRYRLLKSAREYALAKLDEAGEPQLAQRRLARAMLVLFRRYRKQQYAGVAESVRLATYSCEIDNLRAALDWSAAFEPPLAVELVARSGSIHMLMALQHEHRKRCVALEPVLGPDIPAEVQAAYWQARAGSSFPSVTTVADCAGRAAAIYRSIGGSQDQALYFTLLWVGWSGGRPADDWTAAQVELERIEQPGWPTVWHALRKHAEGVGHLEADRPAQAHVAFAAAAELAWPDGHRRTGAMAEIGLAAADVMLGRVDEAVSRLRAAIVAARKEPGGLLERLYGALALGLILQGNLEQARQALVDLFAQCRLTEGESFAFYVHACPQLAIREGRHEAAARLMGFAAAERTRHGLVGNRIERAHAHTRAELAALLDAPALERLMAEGVALDHEAALALTLERAHGQGEAKR